MAASDEFAVEMAHMFTDGVAYAMGVPEAEKDWDRSSPTNFVQKIDQGTGLKVWTQVVADPGAAVQRRIKILCDDEPVLPDPTAGMPFVAVEFVGMTARPWMNDRGCKPGQGRRCGNGGDQQPVRGQFAGAMLILTFIVGWQCVQAPRA